MEIPYYFGNGRQVHRGCYRRKECWQGHKQEYLCALAFPFFKRISILPKKPKKKTKELFYPLLKWTVKVSIFKSKPQYMHTARILYLFAHQQHNLWWGWWCWGGAGMEGLFERSKLRADIIITTFVGHGSWVQEATRGNCQVAFVFSTRDSALTLCWIIPKTTAGPLQISRIFPIINPQIKIRNYLSFSNKLLRHWEIIHWNLNYLFPMSILHILF